MAARTGMANLILQLRAMCNVGTDSYTVGGVAYFSDDHLQAILDEQRQALRRWPLTPDPIYLNGDSVYYDYAFTDIVGGIEEDGTGSGWAVRNGSGTDISNATYAVNYKAKMITFSSDQDNLTLYLDCRAYDMERAAAEVCERIAGFERSSVNWSSDNHKIEAQNRHKNALEMARYWRGRATMQSVKLIRTDENAGY